MQPRSHFWKTLEAEKRTNTNSTHLWHHIRERTWTVTLVAGECFHPASTPGSAINTPKLLPKVVDPNITCFIKVKVKSATSLEAWRPTRPAIISGFCSMKRLGVLILPPGWDASPSQGYPQHFCRHPFTGIHLGGERHRESKVSCPRTQHNVPGQDPNPDHLIQSQAHWPWDHHPSCICVMVLHTVITKD